MMRARRVREAVARVVVKGSAADESLRRRVTDLMAAALDRVPGRPVSAQVAFADDNGPKGGAAMRCALTVNLPRRVGVRVEHVAETPRLAFDGAFARLERRLQGDVERARTSRRRPKKYYLAKLQGGVVTPPEAATER